ncbi:hypothetical protein EZS27_007837 [termite gut metagenome]|uniref:Uncharacterized protein n=1 Tax=termite gut metagenome TaxID=433724 RepID=A0A5J4SFG9_9ZZZZ
MRGIDLCIRKEKEKAYLQNPSQSCSMLIQMNLSEEEIRNLNYKRFREADPLVQKRLHAVYLKSQMPLSNEYIGVILDAHRNSVDRWIHTCLKSGLSGLISLHYVSLKSKLESYKEMIKENVSEDRIFPLDIHSCQCIRRADTSTEVHSQNRLQPSPEWTYSGKGRL